jgi:hypothetical protein
MEDGEAGSVPFNYFAGFNPTDSHNATQRSKDVEAGPSRGGSMLTEQRGMRTAAISLAAICIYKVP